MAVTLSDTAFISWRGIPIVPTDKLFITSEKTQIMLVRTGEQKQGVLGLYQDGLPGEQSKGLSVRFMGIDQKGIGLYLLSLYCSAAILTDDAVGVLENVEVDHYYDD